MNKLANPPKNFNVLGIPTFIFIVGTVQPLYNCDVQQ